VVALFFMLYNWRMCEPLVILMAVVVPCVVRAVLPLGQVMGLAEVSGVLRVMSMARAALVVLGWWQYRRGLL
jgi:hypothetical protein